MLPAPAVEEDLPYDPVAPSNWNSSDEGKAMEKTTALEAGEVEAVEVSSSLPPPPSSLPSAARSSSSSVKEKANAKEEEEEEAGQVSSLPLPSASGPSSSVKEKGKEIMEQEEHEEGELSSLPLLPLSRLAQSSLFCQYGACRKALQGAPTERNGYCSTKCSKSVKKLYHLKRKLRYCTEPADYQSSKCFFLPTRLFLSAFLLILFSNLVTTCLRSTCCKSLEPKVYEKQLYCSRECAKQDNADEKKRKAEGKKKQQEVDGSEKKQKKKLKKDLPTSQSTCSSHFSLSFFKFSYLRFFLLLKIPLWSWKRRRGR